MILGTGGTIAGTALDAADNVGYTAAQLGVAQLVAAIPMLAARRLEIEQVAQLDSKDMDFATWQRLAERVATHLARPEVAGIVITHGTDTLEETAYFLQRVLAPSKPVVITAAMRPATALLSDGPQNLLDSAVVALQSQVGGVLVVLGGAITDAQQVRKVHSYRLNAFAPAEGGHVGVVEEGRVRWLSRPLLPLMPLMPAFGLGRIARPVEAWPRVEILFNHVGCDGAVVRALLAQGVDGLVVAGTGNGSVSSGLEAALRQAQARGVAILRSTRCDAGPVSASETALPSAGALSPVKARVEMLLTLLGSSD
ncbi:asparaginase [Roseateles sp. GG27B]